MNSSHYEVSAGGRRYNSASRRAPAGTGLGGRDDDGVTTVADEDGADRDDEHDTRSGQPDSPPHRFTVYGGNYGTRGSTNPFHTIAKQIKIVPIGHTPI